MEEFFENLLYSATFPHMDNWRHFSAAPEPPECVMRVFVRMELRLQQRYGTPEFACLLQEMRVRRFLRDKPLVLSAVSLGVAFYAMLAKGKHFAVPAARN